MKQIKITTEQAGFLLFSAAIKSASAHLENKSYLKSLGLNKINKTQLMKELLPIYLLEVVLAVERRFKDKDIKQEVVENIYSHFYSKLIERGLSDEQAEDACEHIIKRHDDYISIMNKKDTDWQLYLGQKMLSNLLQDKTENFEAIRILSLTFLMNVESMKKMVNKLEIVSKK